jgi:ribosomal protein L20
MARVKRGVTSHAKHKKVLDQAKGFYGRRKNTIRIAKQAVEKSMQYAYRDRKNRKRSFRALWIQRLNAAAREHGLTYSRLIDGLARPASRWTARSCPTSRSASQLPSRRSSRRRRRLCQQSSSTRRNADREERSRSPHAEVPSRAARGPRRTQDESGPSFEARLRLAPQDEVGAGTRLHMNDLQTLQRDLLAQVDAATDEATLENLRISALGKKGSVSELLKTLGRMSPEERKEKGPVINGLRDTVQNAILSRRDALADAALEARLSAERLDVTLPVREPPETRGRIHPISQVIDELTAIFADMGFRVAEGPDIETDYYNFTALNFPSATRRARCTTPSSCSPTTRASGRCCARIPRLCRSAR